MVITSSLLVRKQQSNPLQEDFGQTYLFLGVSISGVYFSISMSDCWTAAALVTTEL